MFIDIARRTFFWLWKAVFVIFFLCSSVSYAGKVIDIAVNDDETLLLTAQGKTAKLWEIATHKLIHEFSIPEDELTRDDAGEFSRNIYAVRFFNNQVVIAGASRGIYFFDVKSKKNAHTIPTEADHIADICISPNKEFFAAATGFDGMSLWKAKTWELISSDNNYNGDISTSCAFVEKDKFLVTGVDGYLRLYHSSGGLISKMNFDTYHPSLVIASPERNKFSLFFENKENLFVGIGTVEPISIIQKEQLHMQNNRTFAFSDDGKFIYTTTVSSSEVNNYAIYKFDADNLILKRKVLSLKKPAQRIFYLRSKKILIVDDENSWHLVSST